MLVISGAILSGCSDPNAGWDSEEDSSQVLTNNTYVAGRGYYHAPYHGFYPYPYNVFTPGRGYYHGGTYTAEPDRSGISASSPARGTGVSRGGFTRSSSSSYSSHVSS